MAAQGDKKQFLVPRAWGLLKAGSLVYLLKKKAPEWEPFTFYLLASGYRIPVPSLYFPATLRRY